MVTREGGPTCLIIDPAGRFEADVTECSRTWLTPSGCWLHVLAFLVDD